MNSTRVLTVIAVGSLFGATLAACGNDGDVDGNDIDLVDSAALTVCSDVPYAPFEDFGKSADVGFTGFDIDIVQSIADDLDVELKVKKSDFNALQSGLALNSGECDLAASAMTITDERAENIGFSDPYYDSKQSLLVPEGSAISSIDDLEGRKVGVQKGTTGEAYTKKNAPDAERIQYPDDGKMYQAIKAGNVEALLQDIPVNLTHTDDDQYEIVETYETDEAYGLAMKKSNTAMIDRVNEFLAEMKDDGTYQELYDEYFSTQE